MKSYIVFHAVYLIALFITLQSTGAHAQQGPTSNVIPGVNQPIQVTEITPGLNAQAAWDLRRKREEKLLSDTDKLVMLANQLKEEVGKRTPNTLSSKQIKETEEIERLSKSIRKGLKD
jgi:hypothetical protein